jgi:hypothetical protein
LLSVEIEGVVIGLVVRGDGPGELFRRALEPLRTDSEPNHNYSVWFSADPTVFQRLQWGGCTVVRTRDPGRFGRALALHLSGHGAPAQGLLRTDGVVAVHDGRATVLPASLRREIPVYERPLREAGLILHDAPWVDFDPDSGEVVLEPPRLAAGDLDEVLRQLPPARRPEPSVEYGRYPLAGWYTASVADSEGPMSTAELVATVLSGLCSPLTDAKQPGAVARLFERTAFGRLWFRTPRQLLDQIGT